jgi:hypothetical protein
VHGAETPFNLRQTRLRPNLNDPWGNMAKKPAKSQKTAKDRRRRWKNVHDLVEPTAQTLQRKREAGAIVAVQVGDAVRLTVDPHLSIEPLDVYLRSSIITARQHEAGAAYARLRHAAIGPAHCRSAAATAVAEHLGGDGAPAPTLDDPDERAARRHAAWRAASTALLAASPLAYRAVVAVAVERRGIARRHLADLERGLDVLAHHWRIPTGEGEGGRSPKPQRQRSKSAYRSITPLD